MNWYRHPQTVEALAASYVMGSMSARARRRFEQVMARRPDVAQAVSSWAERAMPLALSLPAQPLPADSWARLAGTLGLSAAAPAAPSVTWWRRWLAPIPAGALAMGLVLGVTLPTVWQLSQTRQAEQPGMQLPESYVGVLATAQGKPGLIVSSLRRGTVVDFKVVTPVAVPAGHRLYLWRIDKAGVPTALGVLPSDPRAKILHMTLPEPAEKVFFPAVELAVSVEPDGTVPVVPTQPYVYRGLCGKIWK